MKLFSLKIFLSFLAVATLCAQDAQLPLTTKSERQNFDEKLRTKIIEDNLSSPLTKENEDKWLEAFWGAGLGMIKTDLVTNSIKIALDNFGERSPRFQRALLEAVYVLYSTDFNEQINQIAASTDNPKIFAMAINYLLRDKFITKPKALELLKSKFENPNDNPILFALSSFITLNDKVAHPPLVDLLSATVESGSVIIFSFQRKNRDNTGLAVIRKSDGTFARDEFGNVFYVPQLARALSNMPGYITNGNTPQGVLSIQGIDTSSNIFIGTTPNIQTVLPYEVSPQNYFHSQFDLSTKWEINLYDNLLPKSWKNYFPIHEAYYAGEAGRCEIIAHGSTVDPEYYSGKPYYPNTPTLGCLSAKELWDDDGNRVLSDQSALYNAFKSAGNLSGYLIVVEINDKQHPLVIDEVIVDILKAEKMIKEKNNN
ncbi:MAG: hypothetical protein K8H86_07840 [Ignavibacteriaceae bacterium]|nr:hypothetical protein [Ignavibacteriaceae bacterium]